MAEQITIHVAPRDTTGKNASRRLRREGRIPATLYGEGKDPVSVSVDAFTLDRMLHSETGENTIFELHDEDTGRRRAAMVKDFQIDPVTDRLVHADFIRIEADHALHVSVHVELEGTPVGVKRDGGRLENPTREVEVECLPKDIPSKLVADISKMEIGHTLRAGDLELPEGVTLLTDPEISLASVQAHVEEAIEAELEAAEAVAGIEQDAPTVPREGEDDEPKEGGPEGATEE